MAHLESGSERSWVPFVSLAARQQGSSEDARTDEVCVCVCYIVSTTCSSRLLHYHQ